jgi:hypothetical protein
MITPLLFLIALYPNGVHTEAELTSQYGAPAKVIHSQDLFNKPYTQNMYLGDMCEAKNEYCYAIIQNGVVQKLAYFKPDLK